ncbi:MAG: GIY-YIG nuclease family protein [Bacillota bacterium]
MIKFSDFIDVIDPSKTKVKFNMNASDWNKRALDLLLDDSEEWFEMNEWKTKHPNNNLNHAKYLIALAQYYPYGPQYFMFGGLYKVDIELPNKNDVRGYKLIPTNLNSDYEKRLIIKIDKPIGRNVYNRWFNSLDSLGAEVYELASDTKLGHFPGYTNVSLNHDEMVRIILNDEPSWKEALSNVKGIYAITDKKTGNIYIGSASGNTKGLWQRWSAYADINNLTGGNKAFNDLKGEFGREYITNNFKYSILEIFDTKTKREEILEREYYWMNVFETKKHGLNF